MTFDSVYHMLLFFFNKLWIKPPREIGNYDLMFIKGGVHFDDINDVWDSVLKIHKVIEQLPTRDRTIIQDLFTKHTHITDVAKRMKLTERRIRQIKQRTLNIIKIRCYAEGLICDGKYTPMVYL